MTPQTLTQITFYDRKLTRIDNSIHSLGTGKWQREILDLVRQTDHPELYHLFHNRKADYPTIQFRNDQGFAALAGIGKEASWAVGYVAEAFMQQNAQQIKNTYQQTTYYTPLLQDEPQTYCIEHYLFPRHKRKCYQNLQDVWKDVDAIEERLRMNIYELIHKKLGFKIPKYTLQIKSITQPENFHTYKPLGTFFERGVQLHFATNLLLPTLGAIGTGKSKGYGLIV